MKKQTELSNSNRRGFMKTSGIAAAGAAFAPRIAGAFTGGDDEIKVGLIGCGGKGNSDIRQVLATEGKVKLWAVGDAFEDKAKNTAEAHGKGANKDKVDTAGRVFHGFDAYKKVIDSGVDVVFLVTTPGFRPMHYEYAVSQGKHVFMQKPCAVDAAGVRKLIATTEEARKKNLRVGVGFQRRHSPRYIETIKALQDGAIGDLISFRAYWDGRTPWVRARKPGQSEMEYQMRNWYYFNWLCGDHILEQHIHNLDVCNWVMGDTPSLAQGKGGCEVRNGIDHGETFDHHVVEFVYGPKWDFGTRMHSSCRHIPGCWNSVSEQVHGSKGFCLIGGGKIYDMDGKQIWKSEASGNSEVIHKTEFLDAIRNNKPFNEGDYGASSTMTAIMGRMSTYSGKLQRYSDALASKVDVFPYDQDLSMDGKPPVMPDANGRYKRPIPGVTEV
jgi:myo-inositol 2-dehydrogenase/D-chiro-inositol 1-dehydrogenase